jgi:acyl-CoA thioester hydrolase
VRRKKNGYFERTENTPAPLVARIDRRVHFSEADVMAIAWHGRYARFFEEASATLCRECGLSYKDLYLAKLRAPIVQLHVDYFQPLLLDEEFSITASMIWCDGARLNIEYTLIKQDSSIAATGYTVQMFLEAETGKVELVVPELLEQCRKRWKMGEFKCLK